MNEDIDLEDIEARLYSQIYHGSPEEETITNSVPIMPCIPQNGPTQNLRYYTQNVFIPFNTGSHSQRNQHQNTIYNHYTGHPVEPIVCQPNNNSNLQKNKKSNSKSRRAERRKEKFKINKMLKNVLPKNLKNRNNISNKKIEIVCLSDDEDCIEEQEAALKKNEKDDDVIFVEPEPVPVIDLDIEENKSMESDASTIQLNLSPTESVNSNDFLENSTNEDLGQTRFSSATIDLNTSDANDFIKPANPTDMYETESSCSTSDLSKDIANALKAVVFNEVEFPKEDMFSGNNLDDFSNYITPQRNCQRNSLNTNVSRTNKQTKPKQIMFNKTNSDSSSSESEYEQPMNKSSDLTGKDLPVLSEMQCPVVDTGKSPKKKGKNVESINKDLEETGKRKKRKKIESSTPVIEGRKRKKSRRSENNSDVESNLNNSVMNESNLEYSVCNQSTSTENNLSVSNIQEPDGTSEVDSSCINQTMLQSNEECNSEVQATTKNVTSTSEGGKKRKKSRKSNNNPQIDPENQESNTNSNQNVEGRKKKKKKNESSKDFTLSEPEVELPMASEDPPRPCSASSVSTIEHHESINLENSQDKVENIIPTEETTEDADDVILIEQPIEVIDLVESSMLEEETALALPKKLTETIEPSLDFSALEVVDEVGSTSENDDENKTNASEHDFTNFDDVGNDLDLANCSQNSSYIRDFDVEEIQNAMSDDPNKWKIIARDRLLLQHRNIGPKCHRCHEVGHLVIRCPMRLAQPRCSLCGIEGHISTRCPNKVCTQCGTKGLYTTRFCWNCAKFRNVSCTLCKMFGHSNKNCPDLWRRYYLTTEAGPLVPDDPLRMKSTKDLWCCGCARSGHLEHNCMSFDRPYPPSLPYIQSFDDVYPKEQTQDNSVQTKRNIILNEGSSGQTCISIQITNSPTVITNPTNSYPLINKENFYGHEEDFTQDFFDGIMFDERETFGETREASKHDKYLAPFKKYNHGDNKLMKKFAFSHQNVLQNLINEDLAKITALRNVTAADIKQLISDYRSAEASKHRITIKMKKKVYQQANMILFGVHKFSNGKRYMDVLRSFAKFGTKNQLTTKKRISLYEAYSCIFSIYKNPGINYTKFFRILMNRLGKQVLHN